MHCDMHYMHWIFPLNTTDPALISCACIGLTIIFTNKQCPCSFELISSYMSLTLLIKLYSVYMNPLTYHITPFSMHILDAFIAHLHASASLHILFPLPRTQ